MHYSVEPERAVKEQHSAHPVQSETDAEIRHLLDAFAVFETKALSLAGLMNDDGHGNAPLPYGGLLQDEGGCLFCFYIEPSTPACILYGLTRWLLGDAKGAVVMSEVVLLLGMRIRARRLGIAF